MPLPRRSPADDTPVVTKLDRLARSLPDARDIADELTRKDVALSLGGGDDPNDPVGRRRRDTTGWFETH